MKKVAKVILGLILANFIFGVVLISCIVAPFISCFHGTGITFSDFFKKDISPEKKQKIEYNISIKSKSMSKTAVNRFQGILDDLFNAYKFDYSKTKAAKYPFPDTDTVMKQVNKSAEQGVSEGLKGLDDMTKQDQKVKNQTLK